MFRSLTFLLLVTFTAYLPNAQANAPAYVIDNDHTHIVWRVSRFGFTDTIGTFVDVEGTMSFDEKSPQNSSVQVTIPLSGLRSDLIERENIVRGPHWLNAEKNANINFNSTSVSVDNRVGCEQDCFIVDGEMTFKSIAVPIQLNVKLNKAGGDPVTKKHALGFSATGQFKRSEFEIMTAIGPIGDWVRFEIELLAIANE